MLGAMTKDIQEHRDDTDYEARFVGTNEDTGFDTIVRCRELSKASKEPKDIYTQLAEASRRSFGAEPRVDTPYTHERVEKD